MSNTIPQDDGAPNAREQTEAHFDASEAEAVNAAIARAADPSTGSGPDDRGQRIERIITTKDFLPGGDPQFAARLGIEPRGTRVILGSLRGVVNATERKVTLWQGKELESVWLNGEFEAIMAGTGEVKGAPTAILPKAFGLTIEAAIAGMGQSDPENHDRAEITIDCDIGLEATGRPIPYEWIVIYYREGKAQKAMREVRARSEARLARQAHKALPAK